MRTLKLISLSLIAVTGLLTVAPVDAIENVRGKNYNLTTKHGPWMVMVTSFRNVREEDQRTEGLTAEQAAAELVFELREKGIPAYTFSQDAKRGEIETRDRLGRDDHRVYAAQRDMICVLAGNYEKIDDNVGQKTLNYIKKFHPKFLKNPKSGAIVRADATRGPLSGAFMTINPLVKPEEVMARSIDRETKFLNSGAAFSLVDNPHKYTLRIATFAGKSATPLGNSSYRGRESKFDNELRSPDSQSLVLRAGEDAEQLTEFLRRRKTAPDAGQFANAGIYDAYVYHDKFQSIVTVGGFDSADDPRIRTIAQHYGPKLVPDMRLLNVPSRTTPATPEEIEKLPKILTTHTEQLFPKGADPRTAAPIWVWAFDVDPQVIPVPRIK